MHKIGSHLANHPIGRKINNQEFDKTLKTLVWVIYQGNTLRMRSKITLHDIQSNRANAMLYHWKLDQLNPERYQAELPHLIKITKNKK